MEVLSNQYIGECLFDFFRDVEIENIYNLASQNITDAEDAIKGYSAHLFHIGENKDIPVSIAVCPSNEDNCTYVTATYILGNVNIFSMKRTTDGRYISTGGSCNLSLSSGIRLCNAFIKANSLLQAKWGESYEKSSYH